MNRELLKELGLTDEQIEAVMKSHGQTVNSTKEELSSAQTELESYKTQLSERDSQLEELSAKSQGNEELQSTIDALKEANNQAKSEHQKELELTKLNYELDQALILNKARNPKAVRALLDTETVKFDEEGKLIGLSEQLDSLKESDSYLFAGEESNPTPPAPTHIPGAGNKTNPRNEIDPKEAGRQKALERHKKEDE
ncbi:MAG TPA: phage scaffolding protein [Virgibacillus sp.]|nr:phage scaffolding protein [Virgibacillus sp.]HLR69431.1 phage scaffolding protein [Virgibacillus sp.]